MFNPLDSVDPLQMRQAYDLIGQTADVVSALVFYALSTVLLFAGVMVVSARNPVHAVLFLILAFFNAAGIFLLLGAEFVAMILLIVYVGAVAVLFLFVVMMLNINFAELKTKARSSMVLGALVGVMLLVEVVMLAWGWQPLPATETQAYGAVGAGANNVQVIGAKLYTDYMIPFQLAGLVLLVAMISAIVLTLRDREGVKRQKIGSQVSRQVKDVVKLNDIKSGEGV